MLQTIISHTLRVPRTDAPAGDGAAVARQMDAVLVTAGFKADRALVEYVATRRAGAAMGIAVDVVGAVRQLVGDDVKHSSYFKRFPRGVPDTVEFWAHCLRGTFGEDHGVVDLLTLPRYGRYQHTFDELLDAHEELIASAGDRVTLVHLGGSLQEETEALYRTLAESVTPLGEADLALLGELALTCYAVELAAVPMRENRAVVNGVLLAAGRPLVAADTVVDVLRTACAASGGDVTLATPTRFRSFSRRERRVLLGELDRVVEGNAAKLGDVKRFAERFKRLGKYLHAYETSAHPGARAVFDVARGDRAVPTIAGRAEAAFADRDVVRAAGVLSAAPGMLMRSLDRLQRQANPAEQDDLLDTVGQVVGSVSGRVLCSVREHLGNRAEPAGTRAFTTRERRAWVTGDTRPPLPREVIERASALIDAEVAARLPAIERLVVDPDVLDVALPLSGKASEDGFAVLPRGSRSHVEGEVLRFFTYWRQTKHTTDFDLSALLLDRHFRFAGHVSWTNFRRGGAVYSGDITDAPDGATEFIDIPLGPVDAAYVVPQVNVYSGEGFNAVAESMFGWMIRDGAQKGMPFEARTVRTRSDLRGTGRVALPIVFGRDSFGTWTATWLHLYLAGSPRFNQVETNHGETSGLVRGLVRRKYLTVRYLVDLLRAAGTTVTEWTPELRTDEPVTYVGLEPPEGLPRSASVITLDTLNRLIPA
jgi:hypothetical protein